MVDLIATTKTTISAPALGAITAFDNGVQDPSLLANKFDAFVYLWQRTTPGGIAANLRLIGNNDGTLAGNGTLLYRFHEFEGVSPKIGIGGGFNYDGNDTTLAVTPSLGASYKNFDLDFAATAGQGQRPELKVIGSVGFTF